MSPDNVIEDMIGKLIAVQEKDRAYLKDLKIETFFLNSKMKETTYKLTILENLDESIV